MNLKFAISSCFVILALLILTTNARAQTAKPEELDLGKYFLLLKPSALPILDKFKNRETLVKETDYPNSYMSFAHNEWNGWGEMALFPKKSGGHVVVVTQYDCQRTVTSYRAIRFRGCQGSVHFLEIKGKELVENPKYKPDIDKLGLYYAYEKKMGRLANSDDRLIFELPRERKDIIVRLVGEPMYSLMWNGTSFDGSYIK